MPELVSARRYAEMRGRSHVSVGKLIHAGKIPVHGPDRLIDPVEADAALEASIDPVQRVAGNSKLPAAKDGEPGGAASYVQVRTRSLMIKAQAQKLDLDVKRGLLVDREQAELRAFNFARQIRDEWLNWPPQVAAEMAAELGIDAGRMAVVLERHVRDHLERISEQRFDLSA